MLRVPTLESHGKANLHAGGIGVGVDLARGVTTTAIHHGRVIETMPHSRLSLTGIHIPHWKQSLLVATKAADALNLVFSGVDIALDRDDGPTVLEVNARPGLGIQLANMSPLLSRLRRVEDLNISTPEKGVRIGKSLFGGDVEQEIEDTTGHLVLGVHESVEILDSDGHPHNITAKVDTGAWRTTIDELLARKHGLHTRVVHQKKVPVRGALGKEKRPIIGLTMKVRDRTIKTEAFIADRSHMKYNMIIGRRDLKGFLVDPSKRP